MALGDSRAVARRHLREQSLAHLPCATAEGDADLQGEVEAVGVAVAVGGTPGVDAPQEVFGCGAGEDTRDGIEDQAGGEGGGQGVPRVVATGGLRQRERRDGGPAGVGPRGDGDVAETRDGVGNHLHDHGHPVLVGRGGVAVGVRDGPGQGDRRGGDERDTGEGMDVEASEGGEGQTGREGGGQGVAQGPVAAGGGGEG